MSRKISDGNSFTGEVFRSPQNALILSVLVGNGAQLCAMVGVTLGKP